MTEKRRRVETSNRDVEQRRQAGVVRPHRLTVRTPLFQGGNRSSILLGGRSKEKKASSKDVTQTRRAKTLLAAVARRLRATPLLDAVTRRLFSVRADSSTGRATDS